MNRVGFFVDGFNLFHSLKAVERDMPGVQVKWLDLEGLCREYLSQIGGGAELAEIHYFTAYAEHLDPEALGKVRRHKLYVRALTAMKQAEIHLSRFQSKQVWSHDDQKWHKVYEEKETDVDLACHMMELASRDRLDTAVLLSGDSDFVPLCGSFQRTYPSKIFAVLFPYKRVSKELRKRTPLHFTITKELMVRHQLPDVVELPSTKTIRIPDAWKARES